MATRNTKLKTWGDSGTEYPNGYNYSQGAPPVDEWDDFLVYNLIEDVKWLLNQVNASQNGVTVEEDGTGVASPATAINFAGHLNVTDDGDGSVTIDPAHNHDGRYVNVSGDSMNGDLDMGQNELKNVVIEKRTSDPSSPVEGQEWIRTDL